MKQTKILIILIVMVIGFAGLGYYLGDKIDSIIEVFRSWGIGG